MTSANDHTVPAGAIATALAMTTALSGDDSLPDEFPRELAEDFQHWGHDTILEGFSVLIGSAVSLLDGVHIEDESGEAGADATGAPTTLRLFVPAVLSRLRRMNLREVPEEALPTVAGILTAAALGHSPYRWRRGVGPIPQEEGLLWCYTTWLLVDFIDSSVMNRDGGFATLLTASMDLPLEEEP